MAGLHSNLGQYGLGAAMAEGVKFPVIGQLTGKFFLFLGEFAGCLRVLRLLIMV
jgi:hypothetical protein